MLMTRGFWQLANDGMVHAATARYMQHQSATRETGQEDVEMGPLATGQLYPKEKRVG